MEVREGAGQDAVQGRSSVRLMPQGGYVALEAILREARERAVLGHRAGGCVKLPGILTPVASKRPQGQAPEKMRCELLAEAPQPGRGSAGQLGARGLGVCRGRQQCP